ncbi:hypothetical protein CAC42_5882 [Sphaceloma murrayae]|uniref:Vezatin n=1 Tax=Sphaceloma murrayae TaxID=2082308 RepID=A0A2K1QZF5_9PEZI|nr:hypothetical protein CAC42_5882 [Sphaceloma murrayae]
MESIVPDDTPLSSLLEGEGQHEGHHPSSERSSSPDPQARPTFAPKASSTLHARLQTSALRRLHLPLGDTRSFSQAKEACSQAFNMHARENHDAHFLEHFRYIIIASQLLDENPDHAALQASRGAEAEERTDRLRPRGSSTAGGAIVSAAVAFILVAMFKAAASGYLSPSRVAVVMFLVCTLLVSRKLYSRYRRSSAIRQGAVEAASSLTIALQAFELVTISSLTLVQEVELVAKGYRFSSPLPPVTRLDDVKTLRRCLPLRRQLYRVYTDLLRALVHAHSQLQTYVDYDDYIKYLDVYDIPREAIGDCLMAHDMEDVDQEALGTLRLLSFRVSVMRRTMLCSLLSMKAGTDAVDASRWLAATETSLSLANATRVGARTLKTSLKELEDFAVPTIAKPTKHSNDRVKTQMRKISNLSTGIRGLQAKMTLLREESNAALSNADDLTDLGPSLLSQYESIGADIHALLADWESGKAALTTNIIKHERRISLASSNGMRSPISGSFHGLAAVNEGGPADALRALNGDREPSVSPRSSMPSTPRDEEVFEAIAMPKQRSQLTREERIRIMHEERAKQEERREMRDSGVNMMKELKSVIGVRKRGRTDSEGSRIMSM